MLDESGGNIIEVKDLVAQYGARRVLDGVTFDVPQGAVTVVMGGSGSGKTTLLRNLIGLMRPAGGEILFKGESLQELFERDEMEVRKRMGVLFQGGALLNSMTVAENIALPLREHTKLDNQVIDIVVRMKLEQVGLAGFGDLLPGQLSGGMKKRAGLARALAMDPEIIFVDEPSAGLDPITAAGLDRLLLNLKETFNMTIVVVTHELASIHAIADWVCMIHGGRVLYTGPFDEMLESTDERIRQFLDRQPKTIEFDPEAQLKLLTGEV